MARGITPTSLTVGSTTTTLNPGTGEFTTVILAGMMVNATGGLSFSSMEASGRNAVAGSIKRPARTIQVVHEVAGDGATYETNLAAVKALYAPDRNTQTLAFDYDGTTYNASVRLVRVQPWALGAKTGRPVQGEWELLDTIYQAASGSTTGPTAKSALPAQLSVSNAGNVTTHGVTITLNPTAAKAASAGARYRQPFVIVPHAPRGGYQPVEVTGAGWNHAAEVTATRSQASGNDVRLYVNNLHTPRWAGPGAAAFNQATTRIWATLDLPAERYWTLTAAEANNSTAFTVDEALVGMPPAPFWLFVDGTTSDELVLVTAYDDESRTLTVDRAERGTTAVAHSAGDKVYICVVADLIYGQTSGTLPPLKLDDRFKPTPAESATSTNSVWDIDEYAESGTAGQLAQPYPRPGAFRLIQMDRLDDKNLYSEWIPWSATTSTNADPVTDLVIAYRAAGAKPGQPISKGWGLSTVVGVSQLDFRQVTTGLTMGGVWGPVEDREGRLEVWATLEDGTEHRAGTYHDDDDQGIGSGPGGTSSPTLTFAVPAIDTRFQIHRWDNANREYVTSPIGPEQPVDGSGFVVDNVQLTFASAQRIGVLAGAREDIYQFGSYQSPATLIARDASSNERTMYLHGIVVELNDTLTVNVDAGTVTVSTGEGFANAWSGTLPAVAKGTVTLEYNDSAIGTVSMGATVKAARN